MRRSLFFLVAVIASIHIVGSWVLATGGAIWVAKFTGAPREALLGSIPKAPIVPIHYLAMGRLLLGFNSNEPFGGIIIATWAVWLLSVLSICFVGFRLYRRASLRRQGIPLGSKKRGFEALAASEPPSSKST